MVFIALNIEVHCAGELLIPARYRTPPPGGAVLLYWRAAQTMRGHVGTKAKPVKRSGVSRPRDDLVREFIQSAGLGECSQLCDVGQVRHVCDLVPEAFFAAKHGCSHGLVDGLNRNLIGPLERYLSTLSVPAGRRGVRLEVEPTGQLIEAVGEVTRQIEQGPWDDADGEHCRQLLECAWHKWIAYVASVWMWSEVPKLIASQQLARSNGRKGGRSAGASRERIVQEYERLARSKEPHEVAGAVAVIVGKTPQWVRRVWKEHEAQKRETKPAG